VREARRDERALDAAPPELRERRGREERRYAVVKEKTSAACRLAIDGRNEEGGVRWYRCC
jgi:hypothetical protein